MKPFIRSISSKHLLAKSSSDSAHTWFSKAASFVGRCRAVVRSRQEENAISSPQAFSTAGTNFYTRQARCPRRNLRPCKGTCDTHTAATHHAQIAPSSDTPPSRAHGKAHTRKSAHTIRRPAGPLLPGADLALAPRPVLTMTNTSPGSSAPALHLR